MNSSWEEIDLGDAAQRAALTDALVRLRCDGEPPRLTDDPAWLLEAEGRGPQDVRVFVCRDGEALIGYAPLLLQPWSLRFRVGELTLFSWPLRRWHANGGPVLLESLSSDERQELMASLLRRLRERLGRRQVVSLEGVVACGALDAAVNRADARRAFVVVEPTPRYERALIRLPTSFDEYLRSRKPQTRQNLRNAQRKLEKHVEGRLRLVRCVRPEDVTAFVERAVPLSRKTYQWQLLGLGLRDPRGLADTLSAMASRGWTRCYLLECAGAPAAFMLGYLYAGTYYYVDVGFDPAWEEWSVGTVLHLLVLRELIESGDGVEWFDFSSGTGVHKKRFGNVARPEVNYVLLPRTASNIALVAMLGALDGAAAAAVGLLERLRLKGAIKRLVRRAATSRAKVA